MKTFKLSKKLLITSAFCLSSLFVTALASAQDVSYASAGAGGATAYSADSGPTLGGYGIYSYPTTYTVPASYGVYSTGCGNPCSQGYAVQAVPTCDPCYGGTSILQSLPVISTLSSPCGGFGGLGFSGLNYTSLSTGFGFGHHLRYLSI